MARLTRLVIVLASGFSFATAIPAQSHAGVIPWIYDAVFGPVGSLRATPGYAGYAPMTAGYAPYSTNYVSYGAAYSSYAPMSSVAYGSPSSVAYGSTGSGCSSCNQTSSYAPTMGPVPITGYYGAAGCNSCGTGNCSTGSNCSNCTVNSAPTTSGYGSTGVSGPTPDPNFNSREENRRFHDLERKLEELDHRQKEDEKFLKQQHKGDYLPDQFTPRTYREREEEYVPARRNQTIESDSANPNFQGPIIRGKTAPSTNPTEEDRLKPNLGVPKTDEDKSSGKKSDEATKVKEAEPQALRLDTRVTTRAVAPRERMQIVTNQNKITIAKSSKNTVKTSETSGSTKLAQH